MNILIIFFITKYIFFKISIDFFIIRKKIKININLKIIN